MNKEDKSKLELIGEIAQANNKNLALIEEINDLQQRIDKAIEYIENDLQISVLPNNQIINGTEVVKRINKIIDILKGNDTNEK